MNLLIAFIKNISIATFAVIWLILNVSFPKEVSLDYPYDFLPKDWILYTSLGFVAAFNLMMVFFLRLLENIPIRRLRIPKESFWKENELSREEFYKVLRAWFYSFTSFFNLYVCFLLYKIWDINVMIQDKESLFPYFAVGGVGMLLWVFYIAIRFRIQKYSIWD